MSIYVLMMLGLGLGFILLQEYMGKERDDKKDMEEIYEEMQPS